MTDAAPWSSSSPLRTGLAMLLWATDPSRAALCATPFFHASSAASLDIAVELYFTSRSVLLLLPEHVAGLRAGEDVRLVSDYMATARAMGVRFYACTNALAANGVAVERVAGAVDGFAGAAAFIGRALDPHWATLTY